MVDDPKLQAEMFCDLARQQEADGYEAHFEEAVKKIVQAPKSEGKDDD